MAATERPWSIDRRASTRIVAANGRGVASTGGPQNNVEEDCGVGENDANAALIVHAVNCHDELVAACEALVDWIATKPSDLTWDEEKEGEQPSFDLGVAALAKAKEWK